MWITPTWSQTLDAFSEALDLAEEKKKKISHIHSLQGKRERELASSKKIIAFLAGENPALDQLIRIALDVTHIALRELHTRPLVTACEPFVCQQRFFFCWILPLLETLQKRARQIQPQEQFLTDVVAMLQDYYYAETPDDSVQSADIYLNKRITQLLPHGQCTLFKQQLHKNKNRRFFSLSDKNHRVVLQELRQDQASSGMPDGKVTERIDHLRQVFIAGAILRAVEKSIGKLEPQHRLSADQRRVVAACFNQQVELLVLMPQTFLTKFAPVVAIWQERVQQQQFSPPAGLRHFTQITPQEWDLFWPELLQSAVDGFLLHGEDNCYLHDVFDFCQRFAPDWVQTSFTSSAVDSLIEQCDVYDPASLNKFTPLIEKAIFHELKKIVMVMHQQRQLGVYGIQLASMLVANALSAGYRVTQHELTPLLNMLIENLPTDIRLFPQNSFVTPFGQCEIASPGNPLAAGESLEKDDEAMIYAMALREYNQYLLTLLDGQRSPDMLGYPFHKLDSVLRNIFAITPDIKQIDRKAVATLFRKAEIRLTAKEKGNPCWRLSDASPYVILRNLEMFLPLLGLLHDGKVWLQPGLDYYYCLNDDDKKRVLQAIDPQAYQRDLNHCKAAAQARQQNQFGYKANGELFVRMPRKLWEK